MGGFWPTVDVDPPEVPESIGGCVHCEKDLYADRGVLTDEWGDVDCVGSPGGHVLWEEER